jgi:hypothetical protein
MDELTGAERIYKERTRQINVEGWTPEHDDDHTDQSLALAAICYAAPEKIYVKREWATGVTFEDPWPDSWAAYWDKRATHESDNTVPEPDSYSDKKRIDLLVKAGALIAAEIDRLQRVRKG